MIQHKKKWYSIKHDVKLYFDGDISNVIVIDQIWSVDFIIIRILYINITINYIMYTING